jgi:hypothetical protein
MTLVQLIEFAQKGQAMQQAVDDVLKPQEASVEAWTGLIVSALERKRRIDKQNTKANNMAGYDRWLVDAVELLLQIELQRRTQK